MNDNTTEAEALEAFTAAVNAAIAEPQRRRPRKLDREASRTAIAHRRGPSARERLGSFKRYRIEPERGECRVFDRGPALNAAIVKATRRGRAAIR